MVKATNAKDLGDPVVTTIGTDKVRVQTKPLAQDDIAKVRAAIAKEAGVPTEQVDLAADRRVLGPADRRQGDLRRWSCSSVLVFLVIWAYFREAKAAVAAIIALIHDVMITVGVYALVGFEVTPATVIGVTDDPRLLAVRHRRRVRQGAGEHPGHHRRQPDDLHPRRPTWPSTRPLVRSINTSIIALLPVGAILVVGTVVLGAGPLKDLSLALFVGIAVGAYSSIFIAPPLLADLQGARAGHAGAEPAGRGQAGPGGERGRSGRGGDRGAAAARCGAATVRRPGQRRASRTGRPVRRRRRRHAR